MQGSASGPVDRHPHHLMEMPPHDYGPFLDRFVRACEADGRVLAALLLGSRAAETSDEHSDLDLVVVVEDEAYDGFVADRDSFIATLGRPLLLEDFDVAGIVFVIYADGADVELTISRAGDLAMTGPSRVLLDKHGVVDLDIAPGSTLHSAEDDAEAARRQIQWFWHDLSHFMTALGRGQLTWAYGQLDDLRRYCLNLARLAAEPGADPEGYWKAEELVPEDVLSDLRSTMVGPQVDELWRAAWDVVALYRRLAREVAAQRGLSYPDELDRLLTSRLEELDSGQSARPG